MRKREISSDDDRRPIIAGFTREDLERVNRLTHAKNLRSIIKCTKWLNDHGVELLRQYPQEFRCGAGMTVDQYLHALTVHVDCCRAFLERM
jgi:23S rRNA G2069 N7-methylase RlmK/C1962 C5-methylase RlmI